MLKLQNPPPPTGNERPHPNGCTRCGYAGPLQAWLKHERQPKFIALLGFWLGILPGLLFLAWSWEKYKCPSCGALQDRREAWAIVRSFLSLCLLLAGGAYVAIIALFGCNGGAAGSSEIINPTFYWPCVATYFTAYFVVVWLFFRRSN